MTQTEMHKGAGGSSSKQAQKRGRGGKVAVKLGPAILLTQLPLEKFGVSGKISGKKSSTEYMREYMREWRARNPERHRARVKAWRLANLEKHRERCRRYRARQRLRRLQEAAERAPDREAAKQATRLRRKAAAAKYYRENRERYLARSKVWREANPERYRELLRAWKQANRAKVNARKIRSAVQLRERLLKIQRGRCAYCRTRLIESHIDHIEPISRGGSNSRKNLQLTCPACNMAKGARSPIEFARSLGRLL